MESGKEIYGSIYSMKKKSEAVTAMLMKLVNFLMSHETLSLSDSHLQLKIVGLGYDLIMIDY